MHMATDYRLQAPEHDNLFVSCQVGDNQWVLTHVSHTRWSASNNADLDGAQEASLA